MAVVEQIVRTIPLASEGGEPAEGNSLSRESLSKGADVCSLPDIKRNGTCMGARGNSIEQFKTEGQETDNLFTRNNVVTMKITFAEIAPLGGVRLVTCALTVGAFFHTS